MPPGVAGSGIGPLDHLHHDPGFPGAIFPQAPCFKDSYLYQGVGSPVYRSSPLSWPKGQSERSSKATGRLVSTPCFVVPKQDGGLRPIFNLKGLNKYLRPLGCKMLTVPRVRQAVKEGYWFTTIDLKDANAPPRSEGRHFPSRGYLDDWLVCARSKEQCQQHVALLLDHIQALGLCRNLEKSMLNSSQVTQFLGMVLNSRAAVRTLTPREAASLQCLPLTLPTGGRRQLEAMSPPYGVDSGYGPGSSPGPRVHAASAKLPALFRAVPSDVPAGQGAVLSEAAQGPLLVEMPCQHFEGHTLVIWHQFISIDASQEGWVAVHKGCGISG
ncbi:hypothetical protein SKAU_G00274600 [Synaphobranchus kaupii]|uniref:Uncharacterized protein n=1 Tax=Synaphobranchus kaupii TaxID=118154 RepID=A0A9Q1IQX8_SYNKA|nr:hypothetical protein SKAU_G00274600 [Synaphobranchus kaupii]